MIVFYFLEKKKEFIIVVFAGLHTIVHNLTACKSIFGRQTKKAKYIYDSFAWILFSSPLHEKLAVFRMSVGQGQSGWMFNRGN